MFKDDKLWTVCLFHVFIGFAVFSSPWFGQLKYLAGSTNTTLIRYILGEYKLYENIGGIVTADLTQFVDCVHAQGWHNICSQYKICQ